MSGALGNSTLGMTALGLTAIEWTACALLVVSGFFYLAGTVGLLRFPDVHSRLHALTKADNLGLFFACVAMSLLAASWRVAALLAVVWLLALLAAAVSGHLIARRALRSVTSPPGRPKGEERQAQRGDDGGAPREGSR